MYKGLLKQYASYLPVNENTPDVSLMEGNTPLIPLLNISKQLGIQLYGKYEGANPTGSFKDRGMVMAVAKAKEEGSEAIICASTGNTSASACSICGTSWDEMHYRNTGRKDCTWKISASGRLWS